MANRYVSSVTYAAVPQWAASAVHSVGDFCRQLAAPAAGNQRVFRCTTAGTSGATEPTWVLTAGATTADNTAVWTEVTSNATYNNWTNAPFANLLSAISLAAAGDTYYVASDHSESSAAALNLVFKGTGTASDTILCVNRAGSVPPVAADITTGAFVGTTASNNLTVQGFFYCYGIKFAAGTGTGTPIPTFGDVNSGATQVYESCVLGIASTGFTAGRFGTNQASSMVTFINCQFLYGATNQYLGPDGKVEIIGPSASSILAPGSVTPDTLFGLSSFSTGRDYIIRDADLSVAGAGKTLYNGGLFRDVARIINCKINAAVTVANTPNNIAYSQLQVIGCNSSGNVQRNEIYDYLATLTTETTIVRTGGASDGTTNYSWKILPTANNKRKDFPFTPFEGVIWNDAVGSPQTLTVHIITNNGITLNNNEMWLEVEYLGTAGNPMASRISSAPATILTAASAVTADTAAWTTTGLTTPVKQQLQLTFTPQLKGPIRWRLRYVRTSGTVYVCPKAELSGAPAVGRVYVNQAGVVVQEPAAGASAPPTPFGYTYVLG